MLTKNLILLLSLPLLPFGTWHNEHSVAETYARGNGRSGVHVLAREVLTHDYGVKERDLERLCNGRILTGTLPTQDQHQMTLIGIVKLRTTAAQFAEYAEEVERLVATEHVSLLSQIDFSDLHTALQSYPVMPADVREVPSCEVGDCDVKLPSSMILQLSQLDPAASSYEHRVGTAIRRWLQQYLSDYKSYGNTALVEYGDKDPPQSLQDGFN